MASRPADPADDLANRRMQVARAALAGRTSAVVVSAMSPQQPDALLADLISVARQDSVALRILFADLPGSLRFLDEAGVADLEAGRLQLRSLAGSVPRRLSRHIGSYTNSLWDVDRCLAGGSIKVDLLVARVHSLDTSASVSLGPMVGYTASLLGTACKVVFEVAPPFDGPESVTVDLSRADYSYAADDVAEPSSSSTSKAATLSPEQEAIAQHVSTLIPHGATLQLGLGAVPEAVVGGLRGKRGLVMHSGILPSTLAEALLTPAFATRSPESQARHVAMGLMSVGPGQARWPDTVSLLPISTTHNPETLASIPNLWAVNSAFETDLAGRVNAEYLNGVRVTAAGGQADFFVGAHRSANGASVLVLPSRSRDGQPRIVPSLDSYAVTSTLPSDIDYVVTEFGAVCLTGLDRAERSSAVVSVAHPEDRRALQQSRGRSL